jgi:hypothetical protein
LELSISDEGRITRSLGINQSLHSDTIKLHAIYDEGLASATRNLGLVCGCPRGHGLVYSLPFTYCALYGRPACAKRPGSL